MSVTSLTEKIVADSTATIERIQAESAAAVTAVEELTELAIATLYTEAASRIEKAKRQQTTVILSQARQAANLAWQVAKRSALDSVFAEAFTKLTHLPAAEYQKYYSAYYRAVVPADAVVLYVVGPRTRTSDTQAIMEHLSLAVTCEESDAISAGLVVHTTNGVYDLTLDRQFATERMRLEAEVSAELFS